MNQEDVVVLDVRESPEFIQGHIEHAINAPLSKLKEEVGNLQTYKNSTVLIACQTGTRAAAAGKILTKMGIENVMILTGGMNAWRDEYKLPIKITSKNKMEQ
jgi:rhodanese-related sulfurtransferase